MKVIYHFLFAGNKNLFYRRALLKKVLKQTAEQVSPLLHTKDEVDIVFSVNPKATIPELGIGGYTPNAHTVFIYLDPKHPKFLSSVKTVLPRTLAHELHHAVRWLKPGYGQTLGEALITEGLAAHFELEVFGGKPNMWDVAIRGQALQKSLRRARREFTSKTYNHNDWFFGSDRRKIPRWTGYALGFYLVSNYLRENPEYRPSKLVTARAVTLQGKK